jgi:hypothetical protein
MSMKFTVNVYTLAGGAAIVMVQAGEEDSSPSVVNFLELGWSQTAMTSIDFGEQVIALHQVQYQCLRPITAPLSPPAEGWIPNIP